MKPHKFVQRLIVFLTLVFSVVFYSQASVYIYQDFENPSFPPAGWTATNVGGFDWVWTSYASGYGSGNSCMTADFYDYDVGTYFDLATNTFATSVSGDSLSFDHAYATAVGGYNDRLDIYYSTNGGTSWTLLISLAGGNSGPLVTAPATNALFRPTSSQWLSKSYALPVGTNKIKFEGVSAFGNNLYVDNVRIGTKYGNDVGVNSITQPKWAVTPGGVTPKCSVRNYGNSTQSFSVTMTISPGGYSNTQNVTSLVPGQTAIVNFSATTLSTTGAYTVKSFTSLSGDQNTSNDTITNTVNITSNPRNVVLEYCTGTWCQWCPCGDNEVRNVVNTYPNTIVLAYHGGSDPWQGFNGSGIIGVMLPTGYPSGLDDRSLGSTHSSWGSLFLDAEYRYGNTNVNSAPVSLSITNFNYNSGTRALTVNYNATALQTLSGQYKVTYAVVEDALVYPQTGNAYCVGGSTWVHDAVTRTLINGYTGDNVNSGTWNQGQSYPISTTTTLNAAWIDANCKVIAFIFKDNGSLGSDEIAQGLSRQINPPTGINGEGNGVPVAYSLGQNYPNPFNPTTNVHFSIPKDGNVSFKIYNALGQLVATYLDGFVKAGNYNAEIDATNMASGVYFYTLSSAEFTQTKKMIVTK